MVRVQLHWTPSTRFLAVNPDNGNVVRVPLCRGGWVMRQRYTGTLAVVTPRTELAECFRKLFSAVTGMPLEVESREEVPA